MDWLTAAWHLWGWGLSASSSVVSLMATLPGGCGQSVGHALVTCGWGAPPYFAPGLAPLPVCWGWLEGRPCRSVAARGACYPPDVRRGGASSGRSLARSYACGYRSPAELEPRGRARSRRACGSIRPKCHRVVVRFVAANPPLHTHPRCAGQAGADDASPRSSERYARARRHGSGRGACAEVNMLRRAIQPVHAQMLLSHACLLHLSQPFQPLLAVAASTTRSQPCSAACAITVSRRKATFVTHAGTLTPSSPSYIRGASDYGRPSRPQACCTEWQLHSRPCHGAPGRAARRP